MLLPAGLYLGHALGYWATEEVGSSPTMVTGHGYLSGLAGLAVPFTLAVLARATLAGRRGELVPVRFRVLAAQQVVLFVAVEVVEHAANGIGAASSLRETSLLLGAAAQLLVAGAFWALTRILHRVGEALRSAPTPLSRAGSASAPATGWTPELSVALSSLSRRGPPLLLAR